MDWELPKPKAGAIVLGDDLSALSIAELTERVEKLKAEIARTEAAADAKRRHSAAAGAIFGTSE